MKGRWYYARETLSTILLYSVPNQTGPMSLVHGRSVLVAADLENWIVGARQLECSLEFRALAEVFQRSTVTFRLVGFVTPGADDADMPPALVDVGDWELVLNSPPDHPTSAPIETNSDRLIRGRIPSLLSETRPDVLVVGSGDGALVHSIVGIADAMIPGIAVATLSIAGSTSNRLDCRRNPEIAANLLLGLDCLKPFFLSRPSQN